MAPQNQVTPSPNSRATGVFLPIQREHMVANIGGNCGFASIEIIARYQGMAQLNGFSRGKGGSWPESMARWLDSYEVEYSQVHSRTEGPKLMRQFLAAGKPVLFSIPGHALVCCGWTTANDGREIVWVVDNTGAEGCAIKGWPKGEWDRRFDGWVCGLVRCKRPFFPRPSPNVNPRPGPHIDPTPDVIPGPPQPPVVVTPPVPPVPVVDPRIDDALKRLADARQELADGLRKLRDGERGPEGRPGKDADTGAIQRAIEDGLARIKTIPGRDGKAGENGLQGPAGPTGEPGRDGKDASSGALETRIIGLENELIALRNQKLTAELFNIDGSLSQRIQFSPTEPLKLQLLKVK